jgi:hypothetical protein
VVVVLSTITPPPPLPLLLLQQFSSSNLPVLTTPAEVPRVSPTRKSDLITADHCGRVAYSGRPWLRPVPDTSMQVFVSPATPPCTKHRPHHILLSDWRIVLHNYREPELHRHSEQGHALPICLQLCSLRLLALLLGPRPRLLPRHNNAKQKIMNTYSHTPSGIQTATTMLDRSKN